LRLAGNQLTILPTTISSLSLVELDVRDNKIQDLSPVDDIQTLKKLYAENNTLSSHHITVNHASQTQLTLQHNSLTRFDIIPVSTLLVSLNLSHNKLIALPEQLGSLAQLENVRFSPLSYST